MKKMRRKKKLIRRIMKEIKSGQQLGYSRCMITDVGLAITEWPMKVVLLVYIVRAVFFEGSVQFAHGLHHLLRHGLGLSHDSVPNDRLHSHMHGHSHHVIAFRRQGHTALGKKQPDNFFLGVGDNLFLLWRGEFYDGSDDDSSGERGGGTCIAGGGRVVCRNDGLYGAHDMCGRNGRRWQCDLRFAPRTAGRCHITCLLKRQ
jgi:hypothetical protein